MIFELQILFYYYLLINFVFYWLLIFVILYHYLAEMAYLFFRFIKYYVLHIIHCSNFYFILDLYVDIKKKYLVWMINNQGFKFMLYHHK